MTELTITIGADVGPWSQIEDARIFFAQNPGVHFGPGAAFGDPPTQDDPFAFFGGNTAVRTGISPVSNLGTGSTFANQDLNGILMGNAWNTTTLTYSFPTASSNYGTSYGTGVGQYNDQAPFSGFQTLTVDQKAMVRYALNLITQYTGLTFTEITETDSTHASLRFAGSSYPSTSYAYYPWPGSGGTGSQTAGDVFFGNIRSAAWTKAGYAFDTVLHEIGHAVGLKHGHEVNATFGTLPAAHNSTEWSLMTYYAYVGTPNNFYSNYEGSGNQTYMANDIAALQYLYGANFSINNTATTYTFSTTTGEMFINGVGQGASSTNKVYQSIWDGGGTDTYDVSNYSTNQLIDLRPGEWSTFSATQIADLDQTTPGAHLAHGNILNSHLYNNNTASLIENANAGSGNDILVGNQAGNSLNGGNGNDLIATGLGVDFVNGGDGADTIVNGVASLSGMTMTITSYDTGTDYLSGGLGDDSITGGDGGDMITGGAGSDSLNGGAGSDWALFDSATSGVSVNLGTAGAQTVGGGFDVESLTSFENLSGGAYNDTLTGATDSNQILGQGGADQLFGGGGNDTLTGGDGMDAIDGGAGTDQALFGAARSIFDVRAFFSSGSITTQAIASSGTLGTDSMINTETLVFNNVSYAFRGVQQNHLAQMDTSRFDDVLLRNTTTGQIWYADMDGTAGTAGLKAILGNLPAGWLAVGSGDFTGDGRAEVIIQNTNNGAIYHYGTGGWGTVSASLTADWQFAGTGDFTLDGTLDVLVRNVTTGVMLYAEMNGPTFSAWANVGNLGTAWRTVGVGDMDADGYSDVVMQNTSTGLTYYMNMDAGVFTSWGLVSGAVGSAWVAKELADLNGDGCFEAIYQNTSTGQIWFTNMTGGTYSGWGSIATLSGWDVVGAADVDNDGYTDVIVRNATSGLTYYANMDNGVFTGWGMVANPGSGWTVV